ncbi:unnamed protein product [Linum tenue]|uniref:3-hydroxyisobutyryl-CoA hydrolase n=1 Tax=Linum tenue TaxID=586396 RepID=A0AAV0I8X4_9ROSI|nr:unnamed protein product [Linum tenue]
MKGWKVAAAVLSRRAKAGYRHVSRGVGSLASSKSNPVDIYDHNEVLVEGRAHSRTAVLNRPSSLNALNTTMVGSGRAFCAGGDIVALYHLINQGKLGHCKEFFSTLYSYIYLLGTYLKPNVALLNGITMGGGAGVSVPGMFRVATERTRFATPETLIGFHPDAGASFYLSHLPGHLGEYLGLTGETLNGAEMIACGLATHYTHSTKLRLVDQQLGNLDTDDPSVIEASLEEYGDHVHPDHMSVLHRIDMVDKCFSKETVEEIIDALETEASETNDLWCNSTLRRLKECSPLSLKVSLRSVSSCHPLPL